MHHPALHQSIGILLLSFMISTYAQANMGHSSSSFGVLPSDMASAQALSLFNSRVSAVHYNPAQLARDPRGELTGAILKADHTLYADSLGGSHPQSRQNPLNDTPSEQLLIGMRTDASRIFTFEHPIYFGFMAGLEKYGRELVAFNAESSSEPKYLRYDRQPMFIVLGVGTPVWRGIDAGISSRITLSKKARLHTDIDQFSNTEYEQLGVDVKPVIQPIYGLNLNWGRTLCNDPSCWLARIDSAVSYREAAYAQTEVDALAAIPPLVPGLAFNINAFDGYQPATMSFGLHYQLGITRIAISADHQRWSHLETLLQKDDVRTDSQADGGGQHARFRDIWVRRVGVEVDMGTMVTLTSGVALEPSPLRDGVTPDVNWLDNDRVVTALGLSLKVQSNPVVAWPMILDLGFQHHRLKQRDFDLQSTEPGMPPGPYESVRTKGRIRVLSAGFSIKF